MKPIHYILIFITIAVLFIAFSVDKRRKDALNKQKSDANKGVLATISITTIVDPTTGDEFIISNVGENPLDQAAGATSMRSNVAQVLNDIDNRSGLQPTEFIIKTYSKEGKLLGSTIVKNPYKNVSPVAMPADILAGIDGTIQYSCTQGKIQGPGYFTTEQGAELFGMFCN